MDKFKERIIEWKRVRAGDILANKNNWRTHPKEQTDALNAVLKEIGKVGGLISYYSKKYKKQVYIDGHARLNQNPDEIWWIAYTDLNDEEANKLLQVYDPLSAMAEKDQELYDALAESYKFESDIIQEIIEKEKSFDYSILEAGQGEKELDENINTENECPKCGYKW